MRPASRPCAIPASMACAGLAILLVLLFHTTQYGMVRSATASAWTALPALGWSGVDLFFVLSGYLITNILLDTRDSSTYASTFYARRFLRIFPLYYAMLTFFLVIAPRVGFLRDLNAIWSLGGPVDPIWYWLYLSNIEMARNGAWDHKALSLTWSLAIEEQFYLVWPWIVRAVSERRLLQLCVAIAAFAPVLRTALVARRPGGLDRIAPRARWTLFWSGWLVATFLLYQRTTDRGPATWMTQGLVGDPLMQSVGYSVVGVFWGALLVTVLTAKPGSRLARCSELTALGSFGRYGYALYLLHLPIASAIAQHFPAEPLARHFVLAQTAYWVLAIAASYAVARLSWVAIEAPLLRLERHFPYRL